MRRLLLSLLLLTAFLKAEPALADGGHIALHATSGLTTVTVFTAPEPLIGGPADVSVLVQDATSNEPLGNAHLEGELTSQRVSVPLAFTQSGALLAATIQLPDPGSYRLDLAVERPDAPPATFTTTLVVGANPERRTTVILALLFPAAVIALFLISQQLKSGRRTSR